MNTWKCCNIITTIHFLTYSNHFRPTSSFKGLSSNFNYFIWSHDEYIILILWSRALQLTAASFLKHFLPLVSQMPHSFVSITAGSSDWSAPTHLPSSPLTLHSMSSRQPKDLNITYKSDSQIISLARHLPWETTVEIQLGCCTYSELYTRSNSDLDLFLRNQCIHPSPHFCKWRYCSPRCLGKTVDFSKKKIGVGGS